MIFKKLFFLSLIIFCVKPGFVFSGDTPDNTPRLVGSFTIGKISINRKNVFETGASSDQQFPYSVANKIHLMTRESFIRREILFQEGDPYDQEKIKESERLLRSRPIFRKVRIVPQEPLNGHVDIVIETEDVWTTSIQLAYGAAGGRNFYTLGFLEHNFLGRGKSIGGFVRKDIDRFLRGISYKDPQFLGTRIDFLVGYGRDEKGREWEGHLEKPFYSTLVRTSEGMAARFREDEERLFENGDEKATFQHRSRDIRVFGALALTASHERVRRMTLAYERVVDEFSDIKSQIPLSLPQERRVTPILMGFDFKNYLYHKVRGVRTFDREEDINLGWEWLVETGPSLENAGASTDGVVGRSRIQKTFHPWENMVWFNFAKASARTEHGRVANGIVELKSHAYLTEWREKNTTSMRTEFFASRNLDPERQFLLGGENGLRGYSVRQFSGSKKILASLENRRTIIYDWLHLVSLGWAVFADSGLVWNDSKEINLSRVKSDVGLGLRFAPSRSVDPGLIRMDVAYALQDNKKKSRFVINIGAELSFGERRTRKFDQ